MSFPQIDDAVLVAEVRRLAAENPDHVYEQRPVEDGPSCFYVKQTSEGLQGDCLIGQALVNVGVPAEVMAALDKAEDDTSANAVLPKFGISHLVALWAGKVQLNQDMGDRWSVAVADADEEWNLNGIQEG